MYNIVVWGCISASGVRDPVKICRIMNAEKLQEILILNQYHLESV